MPSCLPAFSIGELSWTDSEDEARAWLTGTDAEPVLNFNMWRGPQGEAAEVGSVTATVGDGVGDPVCEVATERVGRVTNMEFQFDNLRADIAQPTVAVENGDPDAGPSATVSASGPWNAKVFAFKFFNLQGPGLPGGGEAGQIIVKVDGSDFNTEWRDPADVVGADFGTLTPNTTVIVSLDGKVTSSPITPTELAQLDGIKTDVTIQQQIDALGESVSNINVKITGAASTVQYDDLTANRVVVSNGSGKIAASGITTTELGYLDNATSNIQQQINELKSRLDGMTATTYVTNALTSIVNKVFGGGTIGPDGNISWGDSRKIAVGNINVWAQASIPETPTTPTTGIVTHTGLAERDIWAK